MKPYSRPILSVLFDVIACLCFIAGGFTILLAFTNSNQAPFQRSAGIGAGGGVLIVGLAYIGIGQVVDYLARTAHNTSQLVDLAQKEGLLSLQILTATNALAMKTVGVTRSTPKYYHASNGAQEGPFSAEDIKGFLTAKTLTSDSMLFREGDTEWRKAGQFPEFR